MHRFARDRNVPWVDFGKGERKDAVWEWDGAGWQRVPLVDRPVERANDEASDDWETDEDLAVAS